jgi:hypothetical protein
VRRTLWLLALVVVAAGLASVVRPPARVPPAERVRGHRVLGVGAPAVRALDVELGEHRFSARRRDGGWDVDGEPAGAGTARALDDLVAGLAHLRALDAFRPRDGVAYGLDRPRATIAVTTGRGVRRLVVGATNAAGSAFYARRVGAPRVVLVGTGLLSGLERVLYQRRLERQPPESG